MLSSARCALLVACLLAGCEGALHASTDQSEGTAGDGSDGTSQDDGNGGSSEGDGTAGGGDGDSSEGDGAWSGGDGDSSEGDGSTSDGDSGGDGSTSSGDGTTGEVDDSQLDWRRARVTNFESYPEEGSSECEDFSGCDYLGSFAALDGQQSLEWVMSHNIAAVHSDDFDAYELHTLRVRDGSNEIDVVVYDMCSDSDCSGCCSDNRADTGFLIDLEKYTADRFGVFDGEVEWACIDC